MCLFLTLFFFLNILLVVFNRLISVAFLNLYLIGSNRIVVKARQFGFPDVFPVLNGGLIRRVFVTIGLFNVLGIVFFVLYVIKID